MSTVRTELLEQHPFVEAYEDGFKCRTCGKPRALHQQDGFVGASGFGPEGGFTRVRSGWNEGLLLMHGPLTDRKIAKYEKEGWYSDEFRQARREKMARKSSRNGNFIVRDGSLIYNPLL